MSNISFDISGKIDKSYIEALNEIRTVAESLGIPFFIIGALARDVILEHCHNIKAPGMTNDIDLGIKVEGWEQFNNLIDTLIKTGKFEKTREKQRIRFNEVLIDIVPFGKVSDNEYRISWPPEHELIMSILGFDEVYQYSIIIRLSRDPILDVKLPSLPGLAILKLLSWKDKYAEREKDAEDLLFIMNNYEHAGNFERLYDNELQLLEGEKFDNKIASIRLLGRDMARICSEDTLNSIRQILSEETEDQSKFNLVIDMMSSHNNFDETLYLLKKLKDGVFDIKQLINFLALCKG
ncbi:MAG: hypothetical protein ACE5IT_05300 [bacterium]